MKNKTLNNHVETAGEIEPGADRKTRSVFLHVETRKHRPIRITFPARRREDSLTRRDIIAAMREAEFHHWQASGGDYLSRAFHPVR